MFFGKIRTLSLLSNSKHTLSFVKNNCFISSNSYFFFSSGYLLEQDVGIENFLYDFTVGNKKEKDIVDNVNKDLHCIFKYKCEDFHVYEIENNKNVLNLEYIKKQIILEAGSAVDICFNDNVTEFQHDKNISSDHITISDNIKNNSNKDDDKKNFINTTINSISKQINNTDEILMKKKNFKKSFEEKKVVIPNCDSINIDQSVYKDVHEQKEWVKFILYKLNTDTQEAIREISKVSDISIKDFYYSGFKDKRSVSTQIVCTHVNNLSKLISVRNYYLNKVKKKILICNIKKINKKIELGEHSGNRFTVVLRHVENNEDYLRTRLYNIKKYGFINYFGMQRFGIYQNTFNKGKALMSRDYKEYIKYVLDPLIFEKRFFYSNVIKNNVTSYLKDACNIYHKKNATFAFRYFTCKINKLFRDNNILPSNELNDEKKIKKYLYSYMTNSEYEAYILLHNLFLYEKNSRVGICKNNNELHDKGNCIFDLSDNDDVLHNNISIEKHKYIYDNKIRTYKFNTDDKHKDMDVHTEKEANYNNTYNQNKKHFYTNEKKCVKGISMETRRFHMHSYNAKIFNMLTSYRLSNFGMTIGYGDYIFNKDLYTEKKKKKKKNK
uniref:TRUD domain-containing protein n=1 Tax=Piliocolobus tephrosceles TaxID=591936 RepID=A0A8C9HZ55_9PRIM